MDMIKKKIPVRNVKDGCKKGSQAKKKENARSSKDWHRINNPWRNTCGIWNFIW